MRRTGGVTPSRWQLGDNSPQLLQGSAGTHQPPQTPHRTHIHTHTHTHCRSGLLPQSSLPGIYPGWYTARPATGHAGGPQATSPLLSSCGRPSAAAALGPPAPTSDGPLRGPGLRCASPQLFTRRTAGAPDAPRGRRRGLHIPALRPVGSAGRMLHQATSSTPDRPLHSPRGRSAAASLPRSSDDPPRLPGHPAAEGSGALIVGRMMPVSKPFLLHARGHRAQLRTPHPVLVERHFYIME